MRNFARVGQCQKVYSKNSMNILIVYASQYGNTEKIARAIGEGCQSAGKVQVLSVADTHTLDWKSFSLIVVGSPTQGGHATITIQELLKTIPAGALANVHIAAFDTRFKQKDHNFALRILMKTIGYAAEKIAIVLESKGGKRAAEPEGFFVTGKEGPLLDGELERAKEWGRRISG